MNLIQRVQDILLKPKDTWPVIAQEADDIASIYKKYLVFLAAIPAIATFIGLSLIGAGAFGVSFRVPIVSGLVHAVVSYVLSLVVVYLLALIADALAPSFGGTKSQLNAFKLIAYGSTAGYVGGIFNLIPGLSMLGILAALYSIYLIYTGIPVLMKSPQDKAVGYTVVIVICGFVAMLILGALTAMFMPGPGMGSRFGGMGHTGGNVSISTPNGEVNIDTAKLDEMNKKMEEAAKRMEKAQASGDTAAAGKAMGEMMGAMAGANGTPIPAQQLKALLPEAIGELKRESIEAVDNPAMGMVGSSAKARYAAGDKQVQLSIVDMGGLGALASMAAWANMTVDRESNGEIEKVYKQDGRTLRERYQKDGSRAEVSVILGNGVMVEATGSGLDPAALKALVSGTSLSKLEEMKRTASKS